MINGGGGGTCLKNGLEGWKALFLSVVNAEGSHITKVPSWVLLTTMCAGDGDLASLSACLLWRPPGWTSSRGHFICRYWMAERKQNGKKETKHVNNAESKTQKEQIKKSDKKEKKKEETPFPRWVWLWTHKDTPTQNTHKNETKHFKMDEGWSNDSYMMEIFTPGVDNMRLLWISLSPFFEAG